MEKVLNTNELTLNL